MLGRGPDREARDTGPGLTNAGIFVFVSLPLILLGSVLVGVG